LWRTAHYELAPGVERGQRDDEGGKHARRLLGVAVFDEEAALVVDEQLVEVCCHGRGHA
jgi:hypothetical protein